MDLNMQQAITQQQKLILTSEMQQSLKILQMPIFELQQDITRELEDNPLLEIDQEESPEKDNYDEKEDIDYRKLIEDRENFNYDNEDYNNCNNEEINPLNFIVEKKTLKDYLVEQVVHLDEKDSIVNICNYIIENIDERGYLSCSIEELAEELEEATPDIAYGLTIVQSFQPVGVAARNLKECLELQLKRRNIQDEKVYELIDEHLELIAENKIKEIARILKVDMEKAQQYCDLIKTLEPKPSRGFNTGSLENYIIPEAYIKKIGNELFILMNENAVPRLMVNQSYKNIIKEQGDRQALEYIKTKLNSALFLVKGIEQRKKTIYRVLEKVVELQREYFILGERYLKPMTIIDIADSLGVNKSTISRAIKDKYVAAPFGTVFIKDLFTSGLESASKDEDISSNFVKKEIKTLIENEDKTKPLSDQDICNVLNNKKIEISRRTVAKYREEMGISSSSKRKRISHN